MDTETASEHECPHCGGELAIGAAYCRHCGRRVLGYELCSECHEPISSDARYCPYCAQRVRRIGRGRSLLAAHEMNVRIRATRLGSLFCRASICGLFRRPVLQIEQEQIHRTSWGSLGVRRAAESIPMSRIATIRFVSAGIWGSVLIATLDDPEGEALVEAGFRRRDAHRFCKVANMLLGGGSGGARRAR